MQTASPPPRRKWHFKRWFIVLSIAIFAWSGWRVYDKRSAIKEAEALGWNVLYTDPSEAIRWNWKNAFRKATWSDGVRTVAIQTGQSFEQHVSVVHRLNPTELLIYDAITLRNPSSFSPLTRLSHFGIGFGSSLENIDGLAGLPAIQTLKISGNSQLKNVDALKHLSTLEHVDLSACIELTDVDALKHLAALKTIDFSGCLKLTNVGALKNLSSLQSVNLTICTGLTRESVDALRAALPKTHIDWP